MSDAPDELFRLLDHHSQSAYSLLQELSSPINKKVFQFADAKMAEIERLRVRANAILERCVKSSRPFNKRTRDAILRSADLSRIAHHTLDRMLRRQLSMKIMEAYRRRGELLSQSTMFNDQPCIDLYHKWDTYLKAERWLASTSNEFPTHPDDALRLIELWTAQGRPGLQ